MRNSRIQLAWTQACRVWLATLSALMLLGACTAKIEGPIGGRLPLGDANPDPNAGNALLCQPGLVACAGNCVSLQSDSANCGACGVACAAPAVCAGGTCGGACAAGFQKCGDSCANLMTDAAHCGSCDKGCDAGVPCFGGVCGCPEGALFCQGQCFDPMSDSAHCGNCQTACSGGKACVEGECACAPGEQVCGSECSNLNSPSHCGACDRQCAAGEICAVDKCIPSTQPCPSGLTRCADACVDVLSTASACGACGTKCPAGQACSNGVCGCPPGKALCGANCVDVSDSALHCGNCSTTCTAGQACNAGKCQCANAGDIVCNNACVNPKTDVEHCGACGTQCTGGLPCTNGKCSCPDGETLCGGQCVSTDSTAEHCGGCGKACPVGESCAAGKCSGAIGDSCQSTLATGITIREIAVYQGGKVPVMKNGQAIVKDNRPVDVVAGKAARFRVFVDLESGWSARTVSARLLLDNDGASPNYYSKRNVTQASSDNSFGTTFNFDVKPEDITATTRYAVEIVECDGSPAGSMGKPRFPASDNTALGTRQTGTLKVRFIPLNANGRTAASDKTRLDLYRDYLMRMYPTTNVEYTVGGALDINQTISAGGNGWGEALDQISNLHEQDNAANDVYYYGLFQPTDNLGQFCGGGCVAGIGFVTGTESFARHHRVALGISYGTQGSAETLAHELGHNHGRPHSPCGGAADPDADYPNDAAHSNAKIGWWGFQSPEQLHDPEVATDIMGYCRNQWVSDYTYQLFLERIAFLNGAPKEQPPPGGMQHFLFLITDMNGPRWGVPRNAPRYPSGKPEMASVLDAGGNVIASITVYRTPMDHLGGAQLLVPIPEPGWHAVQIRDSVPLAFASANASVP